MFRTTTKEPLFTPIDMRLNPPGKRALLKECWRNTYAG